MRLPIFFFFLLLTTPVLRAADDAAAQTATLREQCEETERALVFGCLANSNKHDGNWPASLDDMIASAPPKKFGPNALVSPDAPAIAKPFLYVRPIPLAAATQPLVIEDPQCNQGQGSMVAYCDGHTLWSPGTALWIRAQALAALPESATTGISPQQWTDPLPQKP